MGFSIVFREERLDDRAFADAVRACNAVALPYHAIWNSGLALLILENRGRIVASDAPVFRELERELGSGWVRIVDGDLTGDDLLVALADLIEREGHRIADESLLRLDLAVRSAKTLGSLPVQGRC